jgi:hypothetical protein
MHRETFLDGADVCDIDGDVLVIDQNEAAVGGRFAEANSEQFRGFHVGDANGQRLVGVCNSDVAHLDDFGRGRPCGRSAWRRGRPFSPQAGRGGCCAVIPADGPEVMDLPGFRLHPLKGGLRGFWAVTVRANWRIVWRFDGADAVDVDLIDYH